MSAKPLLALVAAAILCLIYFSFLQSPNKTSTSTSTGETQTVTVTEIDNAFIEEDDSFNLAITEFFDTLVEGLSEEEKDLLETDPETKHKLRTAKINPNNKNNHNKKNNKKGKKGGKKGKKRTSPHASPVAGDLFILS